MKTLAALGGGAALLGLTLTMTSIPAVGAAASRLVTLDDPVSHSRARIDHGALRIGDGSGPLTVDGRVTTTPASTTLSGQVVVPAGTVNAVLRMAPPACGAGQRFLVEELSGSPSPTARFANGVHQAEFTDAWGAALPVTQPLADGSTRSSQLSFAVLARANNAQTGALNGDAPSSGGVAPALDSGEIPVTVEVFDSVGHEDFTVDIQVTGRCGTPPAFPS